MTTTAGITSVQIFGRFHLAVLALFPVKGAVIGTGEVNLDSRAKTITHPNGGVLSRIMVREGQHVERTDARMHSLVATEIDGVDGEGGVRLTADIDQPLGGGAGLRVNGMYENGESFRRNVELERWGFNPTFSLLAGTATRIDLSF